MTRDPTTRRGNRQRDGRPLVGIPRGTASLAGHARHETGLAHDASAGRPLAREGPHQGRDDLFASARRARISTVTDVLGSGRRPNPVSSSRSRSISWVVDAYVARSSGLILLRMGWFNPVYIGSPDPRGGSKAFAHVLEKRGLMPGAMMYSSRSKRQIERGPDLLVDFSRRDG